MRAYTIIFMCLVIAGVLHAAEHELESLFTRARTLREKTLKTLEEELACQQVDRDNCLRLLSVLRNISFEMQNLKFYRFQLCAHRYHEALQDKS